MIGAALGQYGGVWAQDQTRKSFGIAGANVIDTLALSVPISSLDGKHAREDAALAADVDDVLKKLAAEVG